MTKMRGEIVRVRKDDRGDLQLGKRLCELRTLAGLTQGEMATRLKMTQAAISKLETRDDIKVSTLRRFVEALGASLHIDAHFDAHTTLVSTVGEFFDIEFETDDQFVLPIFADEKHRPSRDFVLSIRPKYSEQIIEQTKTVELRRRFPLQVPEGTLAFIYTTSPRRALTGVARIAKVEKMPTEQIWETFSHTAGIEKDAFDTYFQGLTHGFSIIFSHARALKRSIELDELRSKFGFQPPQSFLYAKPVLREVLRHEFADLAD